MESNMKKIITTILIIALAFFAGFYFKDDILKIYEDFNKKIEKFQKIDLNSLIKEIEKQVFAPSPLRVNNPESSVVLTKSKIISETNTQRKNNGLASLSENKKLSAAALVKANDMFEKQYFEHVSLSGIGPSDLVKSSGYDYIVTGENLILGNFSSEKEMVDAWMASPGHRANILNTRYTEIGVAVAKGVFEGQSVWIAVQEFGLPASACPEPSTAFKNEIDDNQNRLDQLQAEINIKVNEINNTKRRDPNYNQLVDEYNQLVNEYNSLLEATKDLVSQYNVQVNAFNQCLAGI